MAPPPPPPGPPPPPPPAASGGDGGEDVTAKLFAEINGAGGDIRAGLKKATKGPVNDGAPAPVPKARVAAAKKADAPADKPAKCEFSGKTWNIEYQRDNHEISIEVTSMKHTVYIYKCEKATVQIKGKCNSISIDSCKKVNVVFETALSQIEIMNSQEIQAQATGKSPSVNMDNVNTVTYYLNAESVEDAHIITAKCAAVNIIRPKPDDPDDILEHPIPEQFLTTFNKEKGEWETNEVSHDD
ncbi:Adenylyl cyclase-associated protein 2 [Porphyridium purpureum]|uniref:Adenylyl cyclase-associated protein 2 n=1 Tax=Porphyridium purpureum TaxID=35688 RepID=A0A5J4YJH4_PORPP|nr:Adenylyl cyclase-associated protein 2 [Porphyridium purpureum]|eukprot:POR5411..scf289_17